MFLLFELYADGGDKFWTWRRRTFAVMTGSNNKNAKNKKIKKIKTC